jgi:RNA polymerase sigma factor (sigma-70 family)
MTAEARETLSPGSIIAQFHRGDAIRLDKAAQNALAVKAQAGDVEARNALMLGYIPGLMSIARPYLGSGFARNTTQSELVNAAIEGSFYACLSSFDPTADTGFYTYWTKAARRSMYEFITTPIIKISRDSSEAKAWRGCDAEGGQRLVVTSLDAPISDENGGDVFGDLIASNEPGPDALVEEGDREACLRGIVGGCLKALSESEARIVRRVICDDMSLEDVGRELSVSRQRVAQIYARARRKLFAELVASGINDHTWREWLPDIATAA